MAAAATTSSTGDAGQDLLVGGDGSDFLRGNAGTDYLEGGGGAKVFYFSRGHGADVVQNFQNGLDKLVFAGAIGFGTLAIGSQGNDATVVVRCDPGYGFMLLQNMAGLIDVPEFNFVREDRLGTRRGRPQILPAATGGPDGAGRARSGQRLRELPTVPARADPGDAQEEPAERGRTS